MRTKAVKIGGITQIMPLHDYECVACKEVYSDCWDKPDYCTICTSEDLKKIIGAPLLIGAARTRIMNRANNPPTEPTKVYIRRDDKK